MEITTTSYHNVIIPVRIVYSNNDFPKIWYNKYMGCYFYVRLSWNTGMRHITGDSGLFFSLVSERYGLCSAIRIRDCRVVVGEDIDFELIKLEPSF